ncbi:MAG: hypothetical protein L3K24_10825 [Gammaproteobacteria bacterium]|nr:hypothetical protein [Gammaproteobacteria bacterium]
MAQALATFKSEFLRLDVVAEDIETEHQQQHLQAIGCYYAQGCPMPADEALQRLLRERGIEYT